MTQLEAFDTLLQESTTLRRELVDFHLIQVAKPGALDGLKRIRDRIQGSMSPAGTLALEDQTGREVTITPDYELSELDKDILFFEEGEISFQDELEKLHPRFGEELKELTDFLGSGEFDGFITDRDGTVNNYCGRYRSSVQSGYNAVFLSRFGRTVGEKPIILTSAPLESVGITDLTVIPEDIYILAGSKGREYRDLRGARKQYPVSREDREAFDALNGAIAELLEKPENRVFGQIGSSFQKKFGESTVAHQDIHGSVSEAESRRFVGEVRSVVEELNDANRRFTIDDTGKDLEISLESGEMGRGFNKGDGLSFLLDALDQEPRGKEFLICGDTASDLPMVEKGMELGASVTTVFVTDDESLRRAVRATGARAHFVSGPDVLVAGLNSVTREGE